jgi:2-keto-4-pentenoate hydratase/2-oxohepta-3-ene-1,7-dioic acid hydratase in catechol pathway
MGLLVGEMWDLDALAEDCAGSGVYEFLLVAGPLPVTGAVGAPVNPKALKKRCQHKIQRGGRMRIARYEAEGAERLGAVTEDEIQPPPEGTDLLDLLAAEPEVRDRIAQDASCQDPPPPLEDVRLLAPVQPPALRGFVVFEEHVEGVSKSVSGGAGVPETWYEIPTFYFGNPYSVIGPYDPVAVPPRHEALDFELEVAAVIGKAGHDLTPEQAREHIAGYTILNDWSVRDIQRHEMQIGLGPAKGKVFANTLGPWIVTPDELERYHHDDRLHLNMEVSINGEHFGHECLRLRRPRGDVGYEWAHGAFAAGRGRRGEDDGRGDREHREQGGRRRLSLVHTPRQVRRPQEGAGVGR